METKDRKKITAPADEVMGIRLRGADFMKENPGIRERLWRTICLRIKMEESREDMPEDINLSPEEMSGLAAAGGIIFPGVPNFSGNEISR